MSQRRFVIVAGVIGVLVPSLWLCIYWMFLRGNFILIGSIIIEWHLGVLSLLWPAWPLLMVDPEEVSIFIPVASVAVNGLLYAFVGWLIWFGLNRKRIALFFVAGMLIAGWYFLLHWLFAGP